MQMRSKVQYTMADGRTFVNDHDLLQNIYNLIKWSHNYCTSRTEMRMLTSCVKVFYLKSSFTVSNKGAIRIRKVRNGYNDRQKLTTSLYHVKNLKTSEVQIVSFFLNFSEKR